MSGFTLAWLAFTIYSCIGKMIKTLADQLPITSPTMPIIVRQPISYICLS